MPNSLHVVAKMSQFEHRVRYHEVDQQGILFNARYFEIADVGHTEFIRDLGWTYPELNSLGADPSVVHIDADFVKAAKFDDVLDVEVECLKVGRSSFVLRTVLHRSGELLAVVTATHVNVDAEAGSSLPLPTPFATALHEAVVEEEAVNRGQNS